MNEKISKKEKLFYNWKKFIMISIAIVVLLPILVNFVIINNNFYSKASNDGWISFWGSYIGGIFGGVGTLIALNITVSNSQKYQEDSFQLTRDIQKENVIENNKLLSIQVTKDKINDYAKLVEQVKKLEYFIIMDNFQNKFFNFQSEKNVGDYFTEFVLIKEDLFAKALCLEEKKLIEMINEIKGLTGLRILEYYNEILQLFNKDGYLLKIQECGKLMDDLNVKLVYFEVELEKGIKELYKQKYNINRS